VERHRVAAARHRLRDAAEEAGGLRSVRSPAWCGRTQTNAHARRCTTTRSTCRRVVNGASSANDTESRSYAGYRWSSSSGLCSKLCSDRDGSRRIGRHGTEWRSRDCFRKLRVLACFVRA
jgi:hypothetical protein